MSIPLSAAGRQIVEQRLRRPTVRRLARRQEKGERLALGGVDGVGHRRHFFGRIHLAASVQWFCESQP